jgi:NAD(P)-dependent dehydrogenase (short-subunit alcohol dehydrogenase family)
MTYAKPRSSFSSATAGATSLSTRRRRSNSSPLDQLEFDVWRQVQAVNVESALLLTQAFVPGIRDRGFGRVIFIVSNTFWSPPGGHMLAHVASKGALIGMARTLAVGLGSDGIAVIAVAPGLTRTPASTVVPAAEFADTEAHQALPRPLTPDDTAAVVAMLAETKQRHSPARH